MSDDVQRALTLRLAAEQTTTATGSWSEAAGRALFSELVHEGWAQVGLPEALGGSGGEFEDVSSVVQAVAASGHPSALADSLVLGNGLLELVGQPLPQDAGAVIVLPTLGTADASGAVTVTADRVAWARWATHLLVITDTDASSAVHVIRAAQATIEAGTNLAGEPRDRVTITTSLPLATAACPDPAALLLRQVQLRGALLRSIQLAAAIESVLRLSVQYSSERKQFGRALSEYQAVQHHLAVLAGEAAAANAVVRAALDSGSPRAIAAAKCRTGLAASRASIAAHQVHGAMGITKEHSLQRFTTALWSWRDEFGSEAHWAQELVTSVLPAAHRDPWHELEPA